MFKYGLLCEKVKHALPPVLPWYHLPTTMFLQTHGSNDDSLARQDLVFMSLKTSVFCYQTAETGRNLITTHNMFTSQSTAVR